MAIRSRGAVAVTLACAVGLIAGCSGGGNEVAPVSFDSVPATVAAEPPSTTGVLSSPTTGQPVATTGQPVATPESTSTSVDPVTTTDGVTGPMFSDALGVKVDSAPGVNTPGDTRQLLPEGLYVHIAWQGDPNDLSVLTARPEDVEILEAYANAVLTYYRAASGSVNTDDPDFEQFYVDGGALFDESFATAREGGYVLDLGGGVVLRPYLPADLRTASSAVVLDCYLEDQEYVRAGSTRAPGALEPRGQVVTMTFVDGVWKVDQAGPEPHACV